MNPRDVPIRFSRLKLLGLSPLHYLDSLEEEREDSAAMRIGRLGHALALRGIEAFAVYDGERRGNRWREFRADNDTKDIVTQKEFDQARHIADAVWANGDAAMLLQGQHEVRIKWQFMGRACNSTVDVIAGDWITELKTCRLAAPGWFSRDALRRHYHAQLAFYLEAARHAGYTTSGAYIVAVESKRPYAVTTFNVTPRALEEGRKLCRLWFEQLLVCEASSSWPAYVQNTIPLDVPEDVELEFADDAAAEAVGF